MAVDTQPTTSADASSIDALGKLSSAPRDARDRSVRRRGAAIRAASEVAELDPVKKPVLPSDPTEELISDGERESKRLHSRAAQIIETAEVQAAIILLIVYDLVSTVASLLLRSHHEILRLESLVDRGSSKKSGGALGVDATFVGAEQPSVLVSIVLRLLDSLAGFTIVFFTIELAVLMFTFRRRFFIHFGYMLDSIVVGVSIALEIYTESNAIRLLGLLRMWRVFRFVGTLLDHEQKQHDLTLDALEIEKTRVLQLQYEVQAAEQSLKRELESRSGMERMLQGYKDEAETLREALTIAAQAVAEATMQGANPEEDEGAADVGAGDNTYNDAYVYDQAEAADIAEAVYVDQGPDLDYWEDAASSMAIAVEDQTKHKEAIQVDAYEEHDDEDAEFADARVD